MLENIRLEIEYRTGSDTKLPSSRDLPDIVQTGRKQVLFALKKLVSPLALLSMGLIDSKIV